MCNYFAISKSSPSRDNDYEKIYLLLMIVVKLPLSL